MIDRLKLLDDLRELELRFDFCVDKLNDDSVDVIDRLFLYRDALETWSVIYRIRCHYL